MQVLVQSSYESLRLTVQDLRARLAKAELEAEERVAQEAKDFEEQERLKALQGKMAESTVVASDAEDEMAADDSAAALQAYRA